MKSMRFEIGRYNKPMDIDHTKQLPSTVEGNSLESFTSPLGRPSKLDNSRVEELVKWLKLGYYIEDACTMTEESDEPVEFDIKYADG